MSSEERQLPLHGPSEHFSWAEFACHDGTAVPRHAEADVGRLCRQLLEPLRAEFGPVHVVSGYRTPSYNRLVGGAPDSFHIYRRGRAGAAADVTCRSGTPAQWALLCEQLAAGGLGRYPNHVHVDNRPTRARW